MSSQLLASTFLTEPVARGLALRVELLVWSVLYCRPDPKETLVEAAHTGISTCALGAPRAVAVQEQELWVVKAGLITRV